MKTAFRVQTEPFDLGAEYRAAAEAPQTGGVGCFVGQVRDDGALTSLTLEHYPGMTERALEMAIRAAGERFDLTACTVIHRVGRLLVGDPIVLVIAASRHREAALEGTRFLIDWLKTDAPFWKCEERADGSRAWVEARARDHVTRAAWEQPRAPQISGETQSASGRSSA